MKTSSWTLEHSAVSFELSGFITEKLAQVRSETRKPEHAISPEFASLFAAAEKGDWRTATNHFAAICNSFRQNQGTSKSTVVYPTEWTAASEIIGALHEFATGEEHYAIKFAKDIIASIPRGSIYFAGTDAGRYLVTALSKSHPNADPFFTLTQNALADHRSYLRYVRTMYGSRIYIPTEQDFTNIYDHYVEDARRRQKENKLIPGEFFEDVNGKVQLTGQLSVMALNGTLSKLMFDKNPDREFYVEEGFPLNWMYPHVSPHGLILKINRQPLPELSDELLQRDRAFWADNIRPMIGDWLTFDTTAADLAVFVEKVHLNRDLTGFSGDPRFVQNTVTQRNFSKLRSSIGGIYAWRAQNSKEPAERKRMNQEADLAFRQSFALCPSSPEAVFRSVSLLASQKRFDDAILIAQSAINVQSQTSCDEQPQSHVRSQLASLLDQIRKMKLSSH